MKKLVGVWTFWVGASSMGYSKSYFFAGATGCNFGERGEQLHVAWRKGSIGRLGRSAGCCHLLQWASQPGHLWAVKKLQWQTPSPSRWEAHEAHLPFLLHFLSECGTWAWVPPSRLPLVGDFSAIVQSQLHLMVPQQEAPYFSRVFIIFSWSNHHVRNFLGRYHCLFSMITRGIFVVCPQQLRHHLSGAGLVRVSGTERASRLSCCTLECLEALVGVWVC